MRNVVAGTIVATLACAALVGGSYARAVPEAARILDRTFSCDVKLRAGARRVALSAWSGFRDPDQRSRWRWLPFADISNHDIVGYVFLSAGSPAPKPEQGFATYPRWLGVDAALCKPANANVRFSSRGLVGGEASQLRRSDEYECSAPARMLIRLRAEFETSVTLRVQQVLGRRSYTTSSAAPARFASFAAATADGKPIAYATVSETGKSTLFTARNCVAD